MNCAVETGTRTMLVRALKTAVLPVLGSVAALPIVSRAVRRISSFLSKLKAAR